MRRSLFAAAACASAAVALAAQQPSDRQTFRSGREVLAIEVAVRSADGQPLTDLRPSEFTVRIDGQPRGVVNLRLLGSQRSTPSAT